MFSPENLNYYRQPNKDHMKTYDELIKSPKDLSEKIQNIIHLMESHYTKELTERHSEAIEKLIKEMIDNSYAFYYKDLDSLSELIYIMFSRVKEGKIRLSDNIKSLIKICNKPFVREKSSDEINYVPNTTKLLDTICDILDNDNTSNPKLMNLFIETLKFLNDFVESGIDEYKNQDSDFKLKKLYGIHFSLLQTLQLEGTRNLRLVSNSKILESLVYIITRRSYDDDFMIIVINTILNCAQYKINAEKLARLGILKDLVQIISETVDFKSLKVRVCIESIWNILENGGKIACSMMAFEEIVNSLFYTFNNVVKNCFRLEDRNTRNDICILINYVVSSPESHPYFIYKDENSNSGSSSFLEVLLTTATNDERMSLYQEKEHYEELQGINAANFNDNNFVNINKSGINDFNNNENFSLEAKKESFDPKYFIFTTNPEDVEFKKIIWTTVLYIIKDNYTHTEVNRSLAHYNFIYCLLAYLDPDCLRFSCISRWQQPQLKDLHLLCMNILLNIIPLYQKEFEAKTGFSTLIKFLQLYHDKERRLLCLKTINNVINTEQIKKLLTEDKLIDFLLEIINTTEIPLESREYAFNIISQLCIDNKLAQKEFRRKGGIDILKKNLVYQNVIDQIGNQKIFIMIVLDCLWNSIIGNKRNEEQFIDMDGMFTIFELLEQSDKIHIKLILSCLASLVDNKRSYSYFLQWKSNSNSNIDATKLLINIYRSEDAKYGVKYENGVLQCRDRPINPGLSYNINKKFYKEDHSKIINTKKNTANYLTNSKKTAYKNDLIKSNLANTNKNNESIDSKALNTLSTINKQNKHDALSFNAINKGSFYTSKNTLNDNINLLNSDFNTMTNLYNTNTSGNLTTNYLTDNNVNMSIYRSENFIESYLNQKIIDITKEFDLRETIFSIFYRIGFNQLSNVTLEEDKQTLIMIKNYPNFKNLENWLDVVEELEDYNITPISDDDNFINTQIEESKEKLYFAVKEQEQIHESIKKKQSKELKDYFEKIQDFSKLQLENKKLKDKENIN